MAQIFHVAFSNDACVEGFITDDPADADWTATGKPASNAVPFFGGMVRDQADNDDAVLPRQWAVLFDSMEQAAAALDLLESYGLVSERGR